MKYLKQPDTGKEDPMLTLAIIAGAACVFRFVLDGVSLNVFGSPMSMGHVDSLAYSALMTPILAAHGYMATTKDKSKKEDANKR